MDTMYPALRGTALQDAILPDHSTVRIPLTKGKCAFIDLPDFEVLASHEWFAHFNGRHWYAMKMVGPPQYPRRAMLRMHIEIMRPEKGERVDHWDRNGLNNRRNNLRTCTVSQNGANSKVRSDSSSGYKGVYWHKSSHSWIAHIGAANKPDWFIGRFQTAKEAAIAYDRAAIERYKEFARLNFPTNREDL